MNPTQTLDEKFVADLFSKGSHYGLRKDESIEVKKAEPILLTQDVVLTSIQRHLKRYRRQMDVETTLCAYWKSLYSAKLQT